MESAIQAEHELVLLGWGDAWKGAVNIRIFVNIHFCCNNLGLSQKLSAAYEYANSLPPEDILLFTDAFDVLFMDSPARILSSFRSIQPPASILFAG